MSKNLIAICCFILTVVIQPVHSSPVGAIDKLEGEWLIQQQGQTTQTLTTKHQTLKWLPLYSGDQYTLKSEKGCLYYWLMEKRNVNFHSSCPQQNERVSIPHQKSAHYNLASIEISLGTQRDDSQQQLNVNNHLPAKTAIVENTLNISWAEFEKEQTLKAVYLDNQLVSSSSTGSKLSLSIKDKVGWQKWMIILSNDNRYSGQVKKLSPSEFLAVNQAIKSLDVVAPNGRALSRAFIFLENELYLNAWQILYALYQKDKNTSINQLMLVTEQAMGRATKSVTAGHLLQ